MDAAPDFIGVVIGFRQFRVIGSGLWSTHAAHRWHAGEHTAVCLSPRPHDEPVPAKGCTCGFYARYRPYPRAASMTHDLVNGAVALWGRIELHAHGMRAEHASVVAVALPLSHGDKRKRTLAAAAALGIPAVPARRLIEATVDHGHLIPREMQPPDLMPNKRKAPGPHRDARLNAVADGVGHRRHR